VTFKWYHIVLLAASILLGVYLGRKSPKVVVETIYDTKIDTVAISSIVYNTDTIIIPSKIDTNAVVEAFYSKRKFDTMVVSNEVKIKFTGSLYENTLRNVVFETQNLRPTQVVKELKWRFSAGGTVGLNVFSPTLYAQYDKHEVGVGYNLIGDNGFLLTYKYTFHEF